MKEEPLVSVIIPTYKRPGMLGRAIDSVLNQTYYNIEIIVVDDNDKASKYRRETEEFMEKYKGNNKIKYLKHKKNHGGSIARNTGIYNATGKFISFLDDDDFFLSKKIELQINKIIENDSEIVYCGIIDIDSDEIILRKHEFYVDNDFMKKQLLFGLTRTSSLLIKKDALLDIGGFRDLISAQEGDLLLRLIEKKYKIDYVPKILVKRNIHNKNRITGSKNIIKKLNNGYEIQMNYASYLDKKELKILRQLHYLALVRVNVKRKKYYNALINYYYALKNNFFSIRNIFEALYFIFGYKTTNYLKKFIHKQYSKFKQ